MLRLLRYGAISLTFWAQVCLAGPDFEDYLTAHQEEFSQYKTTLEEEYQQYIKIIEEETALYVSTLSEKWDQPDISSSKVWVDYQNDNSIKRKVDFENQLITISVIGSDTDMKAQLVDLITTTRDKAFADDALAQAVENRSKEEIKHLQTDTVDSKPVLPLLADNETTNKQQQAEKIADNMLAQKKVSTTQNSKKERIISVTVPLYTEGPELQTKRTANHETSAIAPAPNQTIAEAKKSNLKANIPKSGVPFLQSVEKYSNVHNVKSELLWAIIETESSFNPMAKSYVPAYGLMQIVPKSAGMDVTKKLFGKQKVLAPSYLYNSTKNIEAGAAYLNILYYRYLRKIEDPTSRTYCVIAAYNTGAGNVAKAFTGKTSVSKAADIINSMSPDAVFKHLKTKLPHEETRKYLVRVTQRMEKY